jgi:glycosyltransferase involved in cell wall biosynthesis
MTNVATDGATTIAGRAPGVARRPRVSVGVPVLNGEDHLGQALDSVLRQEFSDFEIVISDNGSTDGTPDICRTYARQDVRIRCQRLTQTIGVAGNFRRVLEAATGEYFAWLAHDDLYDAGFLRRAVAVLDENPDVDLCGCSVRIIGDDGTLYKNVDLGGISPFAPWPETRERFFNCTLLGNHRTIYGVGRRQAMTRALDQLGISENAGIWDSFDVLFTATLATHGRIVAVPEILTTYRLRPGSKAREIKRLTDRRDPGRLHLKASLLMIAATAAIPFAEKRELLAVAKRNFESWSDMCAGMRLWARYRSLGRPASAQRG